MGPQFFVDGGFVCTYKGITRLLGRGSVRITPAHAGKGVPFHRVARHRGITPARAGKRAGIACGTSQRRDHPRACGEKKLAARTMRAITGSPPRVRGKGKGGKEKVCILRITPARAGKSPLPARGNSCLGDHPRACGEKIREQLRKLNAQGSPPRMRGKV